MVALATTQAPLLIKLPNGQIVPAAGGALVDPAGAPQVAASEMDDSGALGNGGPMAAGDDAGALAPAAAQKMASIIDLARHRAAAAKSPEADTRLPDGGLRVPNQPAVLKAPEDSGGDGLDIAALLKAVAKNSGSGSEDSGTAAPNSAGPPDSLSNSAPTQSPSQDSMPSPSGTPVPSGGDKQGGTGLLDRMKSFLGIGDTPNSPPAAAAAPVTAPLTQPQQAVTADPTGALGQPQAAPVAPQGALVDAPVPTARPPQIGDPPPPQQVVAAALPDAVGRISAATPALPAPDKDYFERLREDPTRMALLLGGLKTMSAASRPGATPLGALGEGGIAGLGTVFEQRAAERAANLAHEKETSEESLRQAQAGLYGNRGTALVQNAETNADKADTDATYKGALGAAAGVKAGAAAKNSDAAMIRAQKAASGASNPTALMKNAQFYVDNGIAKDLPSAVAMVKTAATNPGQRTGLITARMRTMLAANINPSDQDVINARQSATGQVDQEMKAAAPAAAARKAGGTAFPQGQTDVASLRAQANAAIAKGASSAAVKRRFKSMTGAEL